MSGFDHLGVAVGGGHLGKMNSFESLSEFILWPWEIEQVG